MTEEQEEKSRTEIESKLDEFFKIYFPKAVAYLDPYDENLSNIEAKGCFQSLMDKLLTNKISIEHSDEDTEYINIHLDFIPFHIDGDGQPLFKSPIYKSVVRNNKINNILES